MNELQAKQKLLSISQQHVLKYWDSLTSLEQNTLIKQIHTLDLPTLQKQQNLLDSPPPISTEIEPLIDYAYVHDATTPNIGKKIISEGKLGCLIVAGGQGSRLRFNGPKGMFPVTPVKHKSLFQLFAEKTIAAGKQAGRLLPLAIMTSPINHAETVTFFKKHDYFGLDPNQVSIFPQEMLPFLDANGSLLLENPHTIAQGPDGNGGALHHFYKQGIWKKWQAAGVRYLNFILIDNPLSDPYDAHLLSYHVEQHSDVTIKCVERTNPEEKVGIVAKQNGKTVVIEYSEMPEAKRHAQTINNSLLYPCANLSLFCFSMDFIEKIATLSIDKLPLHLAFKNAKILDSKGNSTENMVWKFEKFIFDILPFASKVNALIYPRHECFAPLKNFQGDNSIKTVQHALQERDRYIFSKTTGKACSTTPFEISQTFYYPTPELLTKWHNFSGPYENYIEA